MCRRNSSWPPALIRQCVYGCFRRKNCSTAELTLVTVNCVPTTAEASVESLQTIGGVRFVVNWSTNPAALVGQEKTIWFPSCAIVRVGGGGGTTMRKMAPGPYPSSIERSLPAAVP